MTDNPSRSERARHPTRVRPFGTSQEEQMTAATTGADREPDSASSARHWLSGAWGAVSGIAPHVLHHVGPLAGAALLAGAGGQLLFFLIGIALATPMLIRLHRRFRTWVAPALAIGIFAVTYTVSTLFIGPLVTQADPAPPDAVTSTTVHGHDH